MKKLNAYLFTLLCLALTLYGWGQPENETTQAVNTVVIDPGHGGHDSGCLGSSSKEKHVVLDISLRLRDYIQKNYSDVEVILTRTTDKFIELHKRAEIANENNADLFISVHANAAPTARAYGTETFVMGLHKTKENLRVAKRENSVILKEDNYKEEYNNFDPNSPEAYITFSMYQSAYLDQSIEFASYVEEEFKKKRRKSRGVKQAGFLVLYRTNTPSVLVETGFLTNKKEERKLTSKKGKKKTARAMYNAFTRFKSRMDKLARKDNSKSGNDVVFKVQIMASSRAIDLDQPPYNKLEKEVEMYKNGDGSYKYLVGQFDEANAAVSHRDKLRENGFDGAFVVAFKGNEKIPFEEAISLTKNTEE